MSPVKKKKKKKEFKKLGCKTLKILTSVCIQKENITKKQYSIEYII